MSKALSIAQSGRHFNGGNETIQVTAGIEHNSASGGLEDGITVNSGNGYARLGVQGGNGFLMMGDIGNASSDNNWVIQTDDGDNFLKFLATDTETSLSDLETMASESRGTTIGTNALRAYMKPNGQFVAPIEPRYKSSWIAVNSDDQTWSFDHNLNPDPTWGFVQLAVQGSTSVINQIGYPAPIYNNSDDATAFAFDGTRWRIGIDDDLTYKALYSQTGSDSRSTYTASGYAFRVVLF